MFFSNFAQLILRSVVGCAETHRFRRNFGY